jgi:hypothetical protein
LEQVPWAVLSQPPAAPWRRWAWLIAGALVTAALAAVVARAVWRPEADSLEVTVAPDHPADASPPTIAAAPTTLAEATPSQKSASDAADGDPLVWAEADLRAAPATEGELQAVAHAEWLVTELFTDDGAPGGGAAIRRLLPRGLALPPLPHDLPGPASYVEWARATAVEPVSGSDAVRVEVALRRLVSDGEAEWRRLPVEAVMVLVDSRGRVLDLPSPAAPLPSRRQAAAELIEGSPPGRLRAAALEAAEKWGTRPRLGGAWQAGSVWRLVVEVEDDAGAAWPMTLWLDGEGRPVAPPPS